MTGFSVGTNFTVQPWQNRLSLWSFICEGYPNKTNASQAQFLFVSVTLKQSGSHLLSSFHVWILAFCSCFFCFVLFFFRGSRFKVSWTSVRWNVGVSAPSVLWLAPFYRSRMNSGCMTGSAMLFWMVVFSCLLFQFWPMSFFIVEEEVCLIYWRLGLLCHQLCVASADAVFYFLFKLISCLGATVITSVHCAKDSQGSLWTEL